MAQLAFHWPQQSHYSAEDVLISDCNHNAVQLVDTWPAGDDGYAALLVGPQGSGKTLLAKRWCERLGACMLPAEQIGMAPSEAFWGSTPYGLIENIETITNEAAFFHLLRHVELHGHRLLMTTCRPLGELPFLLPDIQSRLRSFPIAHIHTPDEMMLRAYLTKYCADRQWRVPPPVIEYAALRIERSFISMQRFIQEVEETLFSTNREITIPLIKPLVDKYTQS